MTKIIKVVKTSRTSCLFVIFEIYEGKIFTLRLIIMVSRNLCVAIPLAVTSGPAVCVTFSGVCLSADRCVHLCVFFHQRITALTGFGLECQEATVQSHTHHMPPYYCWTLRYQ